MGVNLTDDMFIISYDTDCRNCLSRDGARRNYIMDSSYDSELEKYKNMTEFEVMSIVEKWRIEDKRNCLICGSSSNNIFNILVDDCLLYDFDNIKRKAVKNNEQVLILYVDKRGVNLDYRFHDGQKIHHQFGAFFFMSAINIIIDLVNNVRPLSDFIPQENGHFFICIAGNMDIKIEKYYNIGLTKEAIYTVINSINKSKELYLK